MSEAFRFRFGEFETRVRFSEQGPESELAAAGLAWPSSTATCAGSTAGQAARSVVLPAGERAKAWRWAERILARGPGGGARAATAGWWGWGVGWSAT